jgi:organic hydroperoxide reductase OsmC/OhrA
MEGAMKGEPVKHNYQTELKWSSKKKGVLSCKEKPDIMVACPPEWSGHHGFWSPEDLFVGATETCIMTTFLWHVKKQNIDLKSYESTATGTVQLASNSLQFISIVIKITIRVSTEKDRRKVKKILDRVKEGCLISTSIKPEVKIVSEISTS